MQIKIARTWSEAGFSYAQTSAGRGYLEICSGAREDESHGWRSRSDEVKCSLSIGSPWAGGRDRDEEGPRREEKASESQSGNCRSTPLAAHPKPTTAFIRLTYQAKTYGSSLGRPGGPSRRPVKEARDPAVNAAAFSQSPAHLPLQTEVRQG